MHDESGGASAAAVVVLATTLLSSVAGLSAPDYRVYVTTSQRTLRTARATLDTWNRPPSARVFYVFGRDVRAQVEGALAVSASQLVFLDVSDSEPNRKDLAIWAHAFAHHHNATSTRDRPSWFVRVDDDCYIVLPRLEALFGALGDGRVRSVVAGTIFWSAGAQGSMIKFFRDGARPFRGRNFSAARARGEVLFYAAGGPGTIVSSAALERARGFEPRCLAALARLESTGCPPAAVAGWARDSVAAGWKGAGPLGSGGEGSLLHRVLCRHHINVAMRKSRRHRTGTTGRSGRGLLPVGTDAAGPPAARMGAAGEAGRAQIPSVQTAADASDYGQALRTGRVWLLDGRFTDVAFGYCVQQLHGMHVQHVGWMRRGDRRLQNVLLQGGAKPLRHRQGDSAGGARHSGAGGGADGGGLALGEPSLRFEPWAVTVHGLKGDAMLAVHAAFASSSSARVQSSRRTSSAASSAASLLHAAAAAADDAAPATARQGGGLGRWAWMQQPPSSAEEAGGQVVLINVSALAAEGNII